MQTADNAILRSCWGEWNNSSYTNRCREFLFKFRNNILGLNVRVNKFVPNHEAECSLCKVGKEPNPIYAETFKHIFLECRYSGKYRSFIISKLFPELDDANDYNLKKFWLLGLLPNMQQYNSFISGIVNIVNFGIWNLKLRKELPAESIFFQDTIFSVYKLLLASSKIKEARANINYWVCRYHFAPP
jgi:hypothetical protein